MQIQFESTIQCSDTFKIEMHQAIKNFHLNFTNLNSISNRYFLDITSWIEETF